MHLLLEEGTCSSIKGKHFCSAVHFLGKYQALENRSACKIFSFLLNNCIICRMAYPGNYQDTTIVELYFVEFSAL